MALKDLFGKKSLKPLPSKNLEQIKEEIESADLLKNKVIVDNKIIPRIDYTDPKNFSFYGSAKKYYEEALTNIYGYYPFDGSAAEKIKWEADASYLDIHIFENEYPSSVGHALFGQGYSRTGTSSNGYYNTSNKEYIIFSSGPNTGSLSVSSSPLHDNFDKSNILDVQNGQESNLSFSGSNGATIEFWLKKDAFSTESNKQVVVDLWNGKAHGQSDYCRFRVEIQPNVSGNENKIVAELMSGSYGAEYIPLDTGITVSDNNWHHYSISAKNEGNKINVGLYVNGELSSTSITGSSISSFKGNIQGHIGALITSVSGTYGGHGQGKLSGSLDDFRFWKTARTNKQIGENWRAPVNGGSNTDTESGTDLTLYYKFNEGIYDKSSVSSFDKKVLDYSGRTTIGYWNGYTTSSRKTTSAYVESGVLSTEKKDPIMYSSHPDVSSLSTKLEKSGSIHDDQNNTYLFKTLPSWIVDEDDSDLEYLTQIMSKYLDELHLQIQTLPEIKYMSYPSGSEKVYPFGKQLLASQGMDIPELFVDSNILEYINDRSDKVVFEEKINTTKNMIYQNIYNNLLYLYRSKGTEKSIRNITRCFGINEDLLKFNMYSNNSLFTFEENYKQKSISKRYADFNYPDRFGATIYQMTSSASSVERSFITGTLDSKYDAHTLQGEFIFPKKIDFKHSFFFDTPFTQVSLMGINSANGESPSDTTWPLANKDLSVYAVRDQVNSTNVYFQLTSSLYAVDLKSPTFRGVYDNEKWNLAIRVKPKKYPYTNFVSGSTNDYTIEFYGVNHNYDSKQNEFSLSTNMTTAHGESFLKGNKRVYTGARRQNNTGSILHNCDALVSSVRYWDSYLTDSEITEHSKDPTIFGPKLASKNYRIQSNKIKANSLLLSWDFDTITTSNASGEFVVTDLSSGSIDTSATYASSYLFEITSGELTPLDGSPSGTDTVFEISSGEIQPLNSPVSDMLWDVIGNEIMPAESRTSADTSKTTIHHGRAFSFPASSSKVVNKEYMSIAKKNLPETVNGDHMIKVLSNDDEYFSRTAAPEEFFFSLEKSMYSSISEEMIKTISSIKDFNNLIGEPVNKYRTQYKELTQMRKEFFENVENDPDVENFLEYYKWIDDSVTEIVKQFIPYSADIVESNANVIESHVLERSKYQHKYPALEERMPSISSPAKGSGDMKYMWSQGHAPVSNLQSDNCRWWNERAEKNNVKILDGSTTARQSLFDSYSSSYKKERDKAAILVVDNIGQLSDNINAVDYAVKETTFGSGDYLLIETTDVTSENIECAREITPDKKIKFGFALKKVT
jgi:hypothetical protein